MQSRWIDRRPTVRGPACHAEGMIVLTGIALLIVGASQGRAVFVAA